MMYDFSVLRDLRKRRKLTLDRLSKACGVSYVALSRLERNRANPELKTLDRISKALGLATHTLLTLAKREEPFTTSHQKCLILGKAECRYLEMDGVRVFIVHAPKGAAGDEPTFHRDDYERCIVMDGQVKITVRGKDFLLGAGEGLTWDTLFDHHYEVLQPSSFIKMLTPKRP
jgi:XRE family transcriptional regulator, regulator of sulfur utilization